MRRVFIAMSFILAAAALVVTVGFVLESFRTKGDFSLRPREKAGMKFTVNETLTHGSKAEAIRWSADFIDEILEVTAGRPSKIRRTFVSFESDAKGPPKPAPLSVAVLLDSAGARTEAGAQPFKTAPVSWPDPFYGALPPGTRHHSSTWESPYPAAAALASFLARSPATSARLLTKLETDVQRDGIECWRLRSGLDAKLDDGRTLKAWGDTFFDKKSGLVLDTEWLGSFESEKGEERVTFVRQRRLRK
ncbi:MAG: hypothetical protein K8T20_14260 [Planctomycetes bacterium]|nr:hypothetical protein [Planctomycetota bacterium]